jgi:hypothetical protein
MRLLIRPRRLAAAIATGLAAVPALAVLTAGPAQAASHVEGYVWASQPATPQYLANTGYEYSSAGQPIVITRTGVGIYSVRFHGLASPGGVAHASAYGVGNGNFCTVERYLPREADEIVRVFCFDGDGNPADSRFVANFTDQQAPAAHLGYLLSHIPNPPGGSYLPSPQWSFDSGGGPIVVTRIAAGRYQVHLAALDLTFPGAYWNGYFRATAVGPDPVHCEVLDPRFSNPNDVPVRCYDPAGLAVDSRFTLTYANSVNVLGSHPIHAAALALPQPGGLDPVVGGGFSPGGMPVAEYLNVGDYRITFPGIGMPFGHAVVNAFGTPHAHCSIAQWAPVGANQRVRVNCWAAGAVNVPTDVWAFNVSFTR